MVSARAICVCRQRTASPKRAIEESKSCSNPSRAKDSTKHQIGVLKTAVPLAPYRNEWQLQRTIVVLPPGRIDRLADECGGIGARPRLEFLETPGIDLCDVKIAFLIRGHAMHAPERSREIADRAPAIYQVAFEIVFQHLVRVAIEHDGRAVIADLDKVHARWIDVELPLRKIFAVLVKNLDAVIVAVIHEHAPGLQVDGDAMDIVEIAWPGFLAGITVLPPGHDELAVLVELRHARAVITVGDKERAFGQPGDEGRAVEMRRIGAGYIRRADGL